MAFDELRKSVKAAVLLTDMTVDGYLNHAHEQLESRGLARHIEPTEHTDTPLWQRGVRLLFWAALAYFLGGWAWAVGVAVVLSIAIWLTKDVYKKEGVAQ